MKPVKQENQAYLKEQILTYLGNKRSLLGFIEQGVKYAKDELKKELKDELLTEIKEELKKENNNH